MVLNRKKSTKNTPQLVVHFFFSFIAFIHAVFVVTVTFFPPCIFLCRYLQSGLQRDRGLYPQFLETTVWGQSLLLLFIEMFE